MQAAEDIRSDKAHVVVVEVHQPHVTRNVHEEPVIRQTPQTIVGKVQHLHAVEEFWYVGQISEVGRAVLCHVAAPTLDSSTQGEARVGKEVGPDWGAPAREDPPGVICDPTVLSRVNQHEVKKNQSRKCTALITLFTGRHLVCISQFGLNDLTV